MEADSLVHGCAATCLGLNYDYRRILPPHWGLVLVRMSPRNDLFYLFDRFCDGNTVVKDALIPDPSLEVDDTGSGVRSYF